MNTTLATDSISKLVAQQSPDYSLAQPFYTDQAIFERDMERIIAHYWQFAGHTARIPNTGDYFLFKVANEEIIISRGRDGEVYALANVCRHRGSRVCLHEEGNAKSFVCPYHAWVYGPDGALLNAKTMPPDFDRTDYGLKRLPVKLIDGLIYINLSDDPAPFDHIVEEAKTYFKPYRLEDTKIAHREVWTVRANWKLVWENFSECYHCGASHPEYCSVMAHALGETTGSERTKQEYADYSEQWQQEMERRGLLSKSRLREGGERIHSCNRHPIKPGSLTQSPDGQPIAPLLGDMTDYDGGITVLSIYPGHFVTAASDHVVAFRFSPEEAMKTEVELIWLVRNDAQAGIDYDVDRLTWVWKMTTDQDKQIVDDNQVGVNSRYYRPGPYSDSEVGVKRFIAWYLDQVK